MNPAPKHPFILNVVVACVSCIVSLLAAEFILRIIQPSVNYAYAPQQIVMSHFRPSPALSFELKPNNRSRFRMMEFDTTIVTNSLGLRDNEVDPHRPRVLCMGDSFTFGFGVEQHEMFCDRLEQLFAGKYDFVNAGYADGFSPDAYALWLSAHRAALNPDKIIVALFQNDLTDVALNTWLRDGRPMGVSEPGLPDRVFLAGTIVTPDGAWLRDSFVARMPDWVRSLIKRSYVVALLRDRWLHDADTTTGTVPVSAENDRKFLRSLDMLLDAGGGHVMAFYIIPEKQQTGPSHLDRLVMQFGMDHHVPVLTDYADFDTGDYFQYDGHWTASGHRKAALYLHGALHQLGL